MAHSCVRRRGGFGDSELLVAIGLVALFFAIAMPLFQRFGWRVGVAFVAVCAVGVGVARWRSG